MAPEPWIWWISVASSEQASSVKVVNENEASSAIASGGSSSSASVTPSASIDTVHSTPDGSGGM